MEKIPTAEEFLRKNIDYVLEKDCEEDVKNALKEFAKLHVEAALKAVIVNRDNDEDSFYVFGSLEDESRIGNYDLSGLRCSLNKDSVLKCYPLKNIN